MKLNLDQMRKIQNAVEKVSEAKAICGSGKMEYRDAYIAVKVYSMGELNPVIRVDIKELPQ